MWSLRCFLICLFLHVSFPLLFVFLLRRSSFCFPLTYILPAPSSFRVLCFCSCVFDAGSFSCLVLSRLLSCSCRGVRFPSRSCRVRCCHATQCHRTRHRFQAISPFLPESRLQHPIVPAGIPSHTWRNDESHQKLQTPYIVRMAVRE